MSTHDSIAEQIAVEYPPDPKACIYCGELTPFANGRVVRESSCVSPRGIRFRPDVSVWDSHGKLIATLEVIDSHGPEDAVLEAESILPNAYFLHVDGRFWCSPECWNWSHGKSYQWEGLRGRYTEVGGGPLDRYCPLPRCEYCDRLFGVTAYPEVSLFDWENPSGEICLECAAQNLDGSQYKGPGECMDGATIPDGQDDVLGSFFALCDAVFWAMVWTNRWVDAQSKLEKLHRIESAEILTHLGFPDGLFTVCGIDRRGLSRELTVTQDRMEVTCHKCSPGITEWLEAQRPQARSDESATTRQLDLIEQAFSAGDWEYGARLLAPIGAPGWSADRDDANPLYAWDSDNCRRTSEAWVRLREWRVTQLPSDLAELVVLPPLNSYR